MDPRAVRRIKLLLSVLAGAPIALAGPGSAATDPGAAAMDPGQHRMSPHHALTGVDGAFLAARFAASQGDLDLAAEHYLQALGSDPDNAELLQQAFLACLLTDRPEARRLARLLPGNPAAQLYLINLDAQAGNWDEAEARVRALPPEGPTQILLPLLSAWLQLGSGHVDAALLSLRPLEADSQQLHALYQLHAAMIADLGNRPGEAGRLYRAALGEPSALTLRLAQIVGSWEARTGRAADAERAIASLAHADGELAIVIPALLAAAGTRPFGKATDGIAESYLALAASIRQQDGVDFAMVLLHMAIDLRPDLTPARLLLSEINDAAKRPAAALHILAPVAEDDPLIGLVRLRRAALTERVGDTDQAVGMLEQIARDYPDRPDALAMVGDILRNKGRDTEAAEAYDAAIGRVPNPSQGDWPLFYARGIALERAHQWPRAQQDFEHALQLSPEQPYVLNYLAYSWTEHRERLGDAQKMIERAMALRPNDGAITDSLGWVLLQQGDTPGAVRNLERAVEMQPEDATINAHLGDAYWSAGRKLEARYQWQRALTLNPEPEDVAKIEAKLHDAAAADGPGSAGAHTVE